MKNIILTLAALTITANAQLLSSQGVPVSMHPSPSEATQFVFEPINPTRDESFNLGILGAAGSTFDVHLLLKLDGELGWTPNLGNRTRLTLKSNDEELTIRYLQDDPAQMLQGAALVPEGAQWLPKVTQGFWDIDNNNPDLSNREIQAWNPGFIEGAGQIGWFSQVVHSPIPEPSTMFFLITGIVFLLLRRAR